MKLDFSAARIVVIGDLMLDRWIYGHVERISPEAPVPVFKVERTVESPGGASNVKANIEALGASVLLMGCRLSIKTRYVDRQHLFRADEENCEPISESRANGILERMNVIEKPDVLVLSDYAKGTLTPYLCREVIGWARGHGVKTIVDPKSADWTKYQGADVITPNEHEFHAWGGPNSLLKFPNILVTYGARGMWLSSYGAKDVTIPAHPVTPKDVTGCGDSVVAALACCLAIGMPLEEAARVANAAGACAVSHQGTHAVSLAELEAML